LKDAVPTAHTVELPNANHSVFLSNEADVLREIRPFFARLRSAPMKVWSKRATDVWSRFIRRIMVSRARIRGFVYGQGPLRVFTMRDDRSLWLTDLDTMQSNLVAARLPEGP